MCLLIVSASIILFPYRLRENQEIVKTQAEQVRETTIKKVYAELAPRMFDQLEPHVIMGVSRVIVDECTATGIDPRFVIAIIETESNFDVEAVSSAGARGLMQILPSTFREISDAKLMFDPEENVRAGIRYLNKLYKMGFHSPERILNAYNQGPGAAFAVWRGQIEISAESKAYIPKVMGRYRELLSQDGVRPREARKLFVAQR